MNDRDRALTYEEAEKLALRAIHDADGRGMVGRGRNHLHQRVARAILSAARDEGRAEGLGGEWVMVPREPTEAMLAAGHQQIDWWRDGQETLTNDHQSQTPGGVGTNCKQDLQDAWKAMLEALPAPPASQTQEG